MKGWSQAFKNPINRRWGHVCLDHFDNGRVTGMGQNCSINLPLYGHQIETSLIWFFIQLLKNTKHQIYLDRRQSTMGDHVVWLMLMCLTSGFHGNPEWQKEWEVPDLLDNSVLGCDLAAGNGGRGHWSPCNAHSHVAHWHIIPTLLTFTGLNYGIIMAMCILKDACCRCR